MPPPPASPSPGKIPLSFVAAGSGLGLFVGLLLGLSSSPVVGSALAVLLPFAVGYVVWFSTRKADQGNRTLTAGRTYAWVVTAFSLTASISTCAGLLVRTHDLLGPSPRDLVKKWEKADFTREQSLALAMAELGFTNAAGTSPPADKKPVPEKEEAKPVIIKKPNARDGALFSEAGMKSIRELQPLVNGSNYREIKRAFEDEGGVLKSAVTYAESNRAGKDDAEKMKFLKEFYHVILTTHDQ